MRQGVVRQVTGMFMVFMFQSTVGSGEGFQSKWMLGLIFGGLVGVLSVIARTSDPTVPLAFVSEIFWAKFKL